MYPTISEVLRVPVLRAGRPSVVAGAGGLGNRVRWVHAAEVADIAHLLTGGELVLTTGVALPDDEQALARYIDDLAAIGIAGLVIELVRRWSDGLPPGLVAAAERHDLPLITLAEETRYVAVTEAIAALISDAQVAQLRAAEQVHETFTALTVAGAEPAEVLHEVVGACGLPVVLETLGHDVLAYDTAGGSAAELLADWARRSREVTMSERTGWHAAAGWLVTVVGARRNDWGRLVLLCPHEPDHRLIVIIERAASALAVHRLAARERESLERQAHRTLLSELLSSPATPADLTARAAALGVPLRRRRLVGVSVRPRTASPAVTDKPATSMASQVVLRDLAEDTVLAARRARVAALVGVVDDTSVTVLLSLTPQADVDAVLGRLAGNVHRASAAAVQAMPVVVGVGTAVDEVAQARRSLSEAAQVARAVPAEAAESGGREFHRLHDVRLRGLLHLLADDDRMLAFTERELGPLLARDEARSSRLADTLRHYCEHSGNKSAAAAAAHVSRTAYYQQLARIEQVLGVSLEDPESVLSLYLALLSREVRADHG
ncbi:MAG: PucR family transcriptional regulator [Thermocrispum sp.]